ncbi:MAG: hypothetical protein J2P27_19685 [Actinobacteria bacterium]|nr:hypothetical protein [Actinomycetota bacterium]
MARRSRPAQEVLARILLMAGLAPVLPLAGVLVWLLGYNVHPHQVVQAYIIAGAFIIAATGIQWILYHGRVKRIRAISRESH